MNIRTAIAADLPAIDKIYNEAIEEGFRTAHTEPMSCDERHQWFEKFRDQKYPLYVYEEEGSVLGWLSISPYRSGRQALSETAEVSFYVDRKYRNKGIGSALMEKAIGTSENLNFHVYIAILMSVNRSSISLLEKFDFREWGYLPEVIQYNGERIGQYIYGRVL